MYSLILMTAMTASAPEAPQFFGLFRSHYSCSGCVGCCGGYSSCVGCCGGCFGYASCHGCYGGCFGYTSCCGGCYGGRGGFLGLCHRHRVYSNCCGCCGGYASCMGCTGCCGGVIYGPPMMAPPIAPPMAPPPAGAAPARPMGWTRDIWGANYTYSDLAPFKGASAPGIRFNNVPTPEKKTSLPESAKLTIEVPANAKVYIDGNLTKSRNEVRHFYTPVLDPRQTYFYDVRVEYSLNGRTVHQDKRVYVQAGDMLRESFRPSSATLTNVAKN